MYSFNKISQDLFKFILGLLGNAALILDSEARRSNKKKEDNLARLDELSEWTPFYSSIPYCLVIQ